MSTTTNYVTDCNGAVLPTTTNTTSVANTQSYLPSQSNSVFVTSDFGKLGSLQPGMPSTTTPLNGSIDTSSYLTNYNNLGSTSTNYSSYGSGSYPTRQSNETDEAYQARVQQYQIQQVKNNAELAKAQKQANLDVNKTDTTATNQVKQLANSIGEGKNDEVKEMLSSIVASYKKDNPNDTDADIMAKIETIYPNLEKDIEEHCSGGFGNSFVNTATFGICGQKTSKDDLLAMIRGTAGDKSEGAAKGAGSVAGGATDGAIVGAGIGTCICPGPGTVIGGAIGAVAGAVGGFLKSIF